jgi:hypothetical protein
MLELHMQKDSLARQHIVLPVGFEALLRIPFRLGFIFD